MKISQNSICSTSVRVSSENLDESAWLWFSFTISLWTFWSNKVSVVSLLSL